MSERLKSAGIGVICVIAFLLHELLFPNLKEIRWFVILFTFLYHGHLLGQANVPRAKWPASIGLGLVMMLAIQSITQTIWYYAATGLGLESDIAALITSVVVAQILSSIQKQKPRDIRSTNYDLRSKLIAAGLFMVASASFGFILRGAMNSATSESIRTPWPLLPENTLLAIFFVWVSFFLSTIIIRSSLFSSLHAALSIAVTTFIAPLVYRVGFGFDGFLHAASQNILLTTGTLVPKPFYYIGQYVFTTWLTRLTDIPIELIDRWLVPIAAATLLPLCVAIAISSNKKNKFGFMIIGLLPLIGFIATTPQGFSYTLGLAALILALGTAYGNVRFAAPLILAAWAIAVHPLAGIPIYFITTAVIISRRSRILSGIAVILAAISIPSLFYLLSLRGTASIAWNLNMLINPEPWIARLKDFIPWIGNRFVLWPAWSSLVEKILPLMLLIISIGGIFQKRNNDDSSLVIRNSSLILVISAISLWIAAIALKTTGDFAFLIDYERGNYADRLNILALLCLIPAAIPGLQAFWERVRQAPRIIFLSAIIFFAAISTSIAYSSLPRHDALVIGRGWSTSRYDIEAVKYIDRDAGSRPYTVLANQSVSAAAVKTLGFKRYADGVFFYPIPTGGLLYDIFQKTVYFQPSRDTVKDAAKLGNSDLVYIVLNDYWWRALAVSEALREIADADTVVGGGKAWIYKFDFSIDSSSSATTSTR